MNLLRRPIFTSIEEENIIVGSVLWTAFNPRERAETILDISFSGPPVDNGALYHCPHLQLLLNMFVELQNPINTRA